MFMAAPLMSTFTLLSEIVITIGILMVFRQSFAKGKFNSKLAFGLLAYEYFVNIVYMVYRTLSHVETAKRPVFEIILLAGHGIISLLMIVVLTALFVMAYFASKKGINIIRKHKTVSIAIIAVWLFSVLSGFAVYFMEYVLEI